MRGLGRLGSAALALLLIAACAHMAPAPTAPPTQSVAPISTPAGETASSAIAGSPSSTPVSPSSTADSSSSAAGDPGATDD